MKNRTVILKCAVTLLLACLLASCATNRRWSSGEAEEPLHGTWVGERRTVIFNPDGTGFVMNKGAKDPFRDMRILIEEQWTDESENTYYKAFVSQSGHPYDELKATKWYYLIRVDAEGDIMEFVRSPGDYPTEIERGGRYFIGFRQ